MSKRTVEANFKYLNKNGKRSELSLKKGGEGVKTRRNKKDKENENRKHKRVRKEEDPKEERRLERKKR